MAADKDRPHRAPLLVTSLVPISDPAKEPERTKMATEVAPGQDALALGRTASAELCAVAA